jgi:predicted NAD/FAD-binding protein
VNRTSFAGAYWGNGFHEDGVKSALDAIQQFNAVHGFQ